MEAAQVVLAATMEAVAATEVITRATTRVAAVVAAEAMVEMVTTATVMVNTHYIFLFLNLFRPALSLHVLILF